MSAEGTSAAEAAPAPAPVENSAAAAPGVASRAHPRSQAPRDSIALAFTDSHYATPYNDTSIPGNRPGHRVMRLGRQHCPVPNKSQLSHALTAAHVPGATEGDGNGCPHLLAQSGLAGGPVYRPRGRTRDDYLHSENYILNSKNGGRRHFDELRGTEAETRPSVRPLEAPTGEARAPVRKGLGVYNYGCGATYGLHEDAVAAREAREREAARLAQQSKAIVAGPPDHSPVELGVAHYLCGAMYAHPRTTEERREADRRYGRGEPTTAYAAAASAPRAVSGGGGSGDVGDSASATAIAGGAAPSDSLRYRRPSGGGSGAVTPTPSAGGAAPAALPTATIASQPFVGGVRPTQDAPDYLVERQMRTQMRETQRVNALDSARREDIAAVRRLPDWGDENPTRL